ncbi:MAG TPA: Dabb family protein [Eudoraea sp.]|nr:Dabb family protein [Eudoraea sp.]
MKASKFTVMAVVALLSLSFLSITMEPQPLPMDTQSRITPDSVLRHVVLFKFKDGTPVEKINEVEEAFSALPSKIPQIQAYEWGLNNSPEGLEKGFTHCFFVTFASEEDRAIYLPHADHQAFVAILGPYLEDVLVVDYWTR